MAKAKKETKTLKRIDPTLLVQKKKPGKSDFPVVYLAGGSVGEYNQAVDAKKLAEEAIESIRPELLKFAGEEFILANSRNATNGNLVKSVIVQDVVVDGNGNELPGESARVTFQARYPAVSPEVITEVFSKAFDGVNPNDYFMETVQATLDSKMFIRAGLFDERVYKALLKAVNQVVSTFDLRNEDGTVMTPLTTKAVCVAKPDFEERRFRDFTVEQNHLLMEAVPNTATCTSRRV